MFTYTIQYNDIRQRSKLIYLSVDGYSGFDITINIQDDYWRCSLNTFTNTYSFHHYSVIAAHAT